MEMDEFKINTPQMRKESIYIYVALQSILDETFY